MGQLVAAGGWGGSSDCLTMASASRSRTEVGMTNQGHKIARHEMCYFCFDVLYCHLYNLQPPQVLKVLTCSHFIVLNLLKIWGCFWDSLIFTAANNLQQRRVPSFCHLEDWQRPEAPWVHRDLQRHGITSWPERVCHHISHEGLQVQSNDQRGVPCTSSLCVCPLQFWGWSWLCRLGSGDSWDQNWVSEWKREQEDSHFFARGAFGPRLGQNSDYWQPAQKRRLEGPGHSWSSKPNTTCEIPVWAGLCHIPRLSAALQASILYSWLQQIQYILMKKKQFFSGAHLPGQGRRESTDKRSELHRCLLARCSIVQDFPLNTNPQFTALPQVMPSAPHTAMLCLTRQTTTNSGVKWIRWLELQISMAKKIQHRKCSWWSGSNM